MLTLSFLIFASYIFYIVFYLGITKSISDSYYYLPNNFKFGFFLFCVLTSFTIVPYWISHSLIELQYLVLIAFVSLAFTGVAMAFKQSKLQKITHFTCACICSLATTIWIVQSTTTPMLPFILGALMIPAGFIIKTKRNELTYLFFAELTVFLSLYMSLAFYC